MPANFATYAVGGQAAILAPSGTWVWPFKQSYTSIAWNEIASIGPAYGDTNASGYEARIAAIPSTGDVTLNPGGNIASALASFNTVILNPGNYTISSQINISTANKKLICPTGEAVLDISALSSTTRCFNVTGSGVVIAGGQSGGVIRLANGNGNDWPMIFHSGATDCLAYHIVIDGGEIVGGGAGIAAHSNAFNTLIASCYVRNIFDNPTGGNTDGYHAVANDAAGANNAFVDCWAYRVSDDGFDAWESSAKQFFYFCDSRENARHPTNPSGDGNGFKLGGPIGGPSVAHLLYKCNAQDNKDNGYNHNSNEGGIVLLGCTASGNLNGAYSDITKFVISSPSAAVEYFGRFDTTAPSAPRFSWSGTTIKARFTGTSVSVDLASVFENNYTVVIDNGAPFIINQLDGTPRTTILLASGLTGGGAIHTVQITRNNSYYNGASTFYGFTFGGGGALLAPATYASSLRLEVYGDSIGAAGGINSAACADINDSEDAYLGYAHVATRALGAQPPTLIVASGHGVYHGYNNEPGVRALPGVYDKTLYGESATWAFPATNAPNVVLIALGTNDPSTIPSLGRDPTNAELQSAYVSFAQALRTKYPSAAIVFTVGPMNYLYQTAALAAKAQLIAAGDSNIHSLIHSAQTMTGCSGHPAYAQHSVMASDLVAFVRGLGY